MIAYLLKTATCLALLLGFYYLVLEREKMHNFNRFYLLGSVFFSFLVPLYVIYVDAAPIIIENGTADNITYSNQEFPLEIIVDNPIDYKSILMTLYFIISSILYIRLGRNLFNIINKTRKNTVIPIQKAILILVDDKILPHTFWNYIFINKNDYENQKIEKELFTHELTHVSQKHTLDILLLEILQAIFWINPFFILLKKAVQLNHEFLADERVIHQHKNITQYQHLLLNKAAWKNEYYLASNLNYSLTKKRLKMMTKQSSQVKILFKKLAVIPLLIGFIFLFAERVEAQETIEIKEDIDAPINVLQNNDLQTDDIRLKLKDINSLEIIYLDKDTVIQNNKASEKQMKEYKLLLNDTKEHNIYKLKDIKKMQFIYSLMSNTQKKSVQNISEIIPPPPPPIKIDTNSNQNNLQKLKPEIINQKDSTKFHKNWYITINGEKYYYTFNKNERIARYYKNGKLVNLDIVKEYQRKNKIFENLKKEGKHYVFKPESEKKLIDREFSDLGGIYFRMSRADKNKVTRPENPIKPYVRLRKNNKVFYKLKSELTKEDQLLIPPQPPVPNASEEEILKAKKAYKAWKKRTGNDFAPPPPPKNHLDQVIEMAKKGAKFYYEKEPINSDKAIALLKEHKNLTIHSESTNNSNYKVWISKTSLFNKQSEKQNIKINNGTNKVVKAKFSIILEKDQEQIKMICKKGCEWTELKFKLNLNTPQIVNKYGLNKVNQRNKDDSFYFVLLQDEGTFDMKSTKNTKWQGLSGSANEKMKLLINQNKVKSII